MNIRRMIAPVAAVLWWFGALSSFAATPFQPPEKPPRFLIVVERSDAARTLAQEIRQTVFDLVYHGANGHMPDGSVFEIWTFGEETTYRGFTPQMLTPANHLQKASLASSYVNASRDRGPADIAKLAGHVRGLVELGHELTVLLVTAPDTRLEGTSRDAQINGFFDANADRMQQQRRPFITALVLQDGEIKAHTVNDSAFTMQIPPMPVSPLTDEERALRFAEARRARDERDRPPPKVEPAVAVVEPKPIRRLDPSIPDEEQEGAIILRGSSRKPEISESNPPSAVEATGDQGNIKAAMDEPQQPEVAESREASTAQSAASTNSSGNSQTEVRPPDVEPVAGAPTVAPVTNRVVADTTAGTTPTAAGSPTNGSGLLAPMAANPGSWLTAGGLFVAGLCFFVVAGLLGWVLMRRARAATGPSFITRSIDRH